MKKFVLALDQGTSSSRALLIDHGGNPVALAQKEFSQHFPKPGWVEHDPIEIWQSQIEVAEQVLKKADKTAADIAAVGITNQRETTILWDRKSGKPIHRAIVWQDRRSAEICEELKQRKLEPVFQKKTGLLLDPYFSGTKIRWLLQNINGLRKKAENGEIAFGTVDSWLAWNLTSGRDHITDATNAARTLLFNIETGEWDRELLEILEIPPAILPEIRSNSEIYATISETAALNGLPLAGMAGDQHAALFGQLCTSTGLAKCTYGTGSFVLMNTGEKPIESKEGLISTLAWKIGNKTEYALEGSIFTSGALIQWLRDELQIIESAPEIESLAATVENNGGVTIVPAFTGLGAPHWDAEARGTILGLTRGTSRGHIARAALEAIAWQVTDVLKAMRRDSAIELEQLRVDGGACANNLLMQIQADFLQSPVARPAIIESTALGAAFLAGLAVGFWTDIEEIQQLWKLDKQFEPKIAPDKLEKPHRRWLAAVERSKHWADI